LWQTDLTRQELMQLALPLGADVPVFIFGQPAFAEGVGEVLTPVSVPERAYVVVQPTQNVPTAGVFSSPDLTRDYPCVRISVFTDWQTEEAKKTAGSTAYFGRNNLEPVVCAKYPAVGEVASWLKQQGIDARMTGSGACFFVEFVTVEQARLCQQEIIVKMRYRENGKASVIKNTWVCPGLIDHPLRYWIRS
jgi:4-diphosphocytidyl-2-C-methyl-D-erythritol kinase